MKRQITVAGGLQTDAVSTQLTLCLFVCLTLSLPLCVLHSASWISFWDMNYYCAITRHPGNTYFAHTVLVTHNMNILPCCVVSHRKNKVMHPDILTVGLFSGHSVLQLAVFRRLSLICVCICAFSVCVRLTLCPVPAHQTWRSSCSSRPSPPAARRSSTPAAHTSWSQSRSLRCPQWLWSTNNNKEHVLFSMHPSYDCLCVEYSRGYLFIHWFKEVC